jgi:transcriptional antiterminator
MGNIKPTMAEIREAVEKVKKINEWFGDRKVSIIESSAMISDYGSGKLMLRPIEDTQKLIDVLEKERVEYLKKEIPNYKDFGIEF